ncbi:MAG: NADPH-dependent F420 reductase [Thermoleophilia bacterium]
MRIAFLGHGSVGGALAGHLAGLGHTVTLGADAAHRASADSLADRTPGVAVASPGDAVTGAELVVLAVPFGTVGDVLPPLADALAGRVLVDATNPVGPGLVHGLGSTRSGAELVAGLAPGARVVKAFSVYGAENLARAPHPGAPARPVMPIAGDDAPAKDAVAGLARAMGWRPLDTGPLAQALHLEHLTLLWVRMVRAGGYRPDLVWAALPGEDGAG